MVEENQVEPQQVTKKPQQVKKNHKAKPNKCNE